MRGGLGGRGPPGGLTAAGSTARRHPAVVTAALAAALAAAVAVAVALAGGVGERPGGDAVAAAPARPGPGPTAPAAPAAPAAGPAALQGPAERAAPVPPPPAAPLPTRVRIPAIGVESTLVRLGLTGDGALEVPTDFAVAGWYTGGSLPGQPGPAVIAGHVDSRRGPAVFYRLRELTPGDVVEVDRSDGSTARFRVDALEQYPKGAFPTDAVYGPAPGPQLRLITCGGVFDRSVSHYRDNVVVYAVAA